MLKQYDLAFFDGRYLSQALKLSSICQNLNFTIAVEAERFNKGLDHLIAQATIAFISKRFHQEYFGNLNYEQNLNSILKMGPSIALTTLGQEGAILKTKEKMIQCSSPLTHAVDTTGAGDAFNGAFLFGYLQGLDLQLALEFAVRYASRKCQFFGARQGLGTFFDYTLASDSK